ncbi:hypothetical protein C8A05DRAFT_17990 [Staphylotrichum tortipilum]|uniref:DUF2470 domain-containing protein n=1 Tax=Staphylotrichum tortipilum TaxID=2831512 RepID=A0AAN6MF16_9PEZI|nr:hypothetical protein C8A05DRAFT_17990 [Staphylotrichum longicolle]
MATSDPSIPPAQKARTFAHMNNDHRADMRHILQHYGASPPVPPSSLPSTASAHDPSADPLLLDISLASLTLHLPRTNTVHTVPLNPPLATWDERRARLVDMTRAARAALGVPDEATGEGAVVVVAEYMPPRVPYDLAIFLAVLFYYFTFALVRLGLLDPSNGSAAAVLAQTAVEASRFPGGVDGFVWLVNAIFVPVVGIHVFETWLLERTKLSKFGVRRGSKVWWMWVGSVFIEGAMAFKRFDIVVARLKAEGKKGQ